jgi:hypothetical protein
VELCTRAPPRWTHLSPIIDNGRHRMNLPDAPIANEGFLVTHFFTVKDQEKSKDFYVRILGGKVIKPENPLSSAKTRSQNCG